MPPFTEISTFSWTREIDECYDDDALLDMPPTSGCVTGATATNIMECVGNDYIGEPDVVPRPPYRFLTRDQVFEIQERMLTATVSFVVGDAVVGFDDSCKNQPRQWHIFAVCSWRR